MQEKTITTWQILINSLLTHVKLKKSCLFEYVDAGSRDPNNYDLNIGGALFIVRDKELLTSVHNATGMVSLYVEIFTRDDSPDGEQGYHKLAKLETEFGKLLYDWLYKVNREELGIDIININITEVIGDVDSFRPILGSRTTVKITWSNL